MKQHFFILLTLCLMAGVNEDKVYGQVPPQETPNRNNLFVSIPPSPNAASLGKYGEVPVDKSTGIPSIVIPLFEIKEGGIEVPVSLSYHAGGIKVQEESSCVGLGWSLNAGGVITRSMRGLPDEIYNGFLQNAEKIPSANIIAGELGVPEPKYSQICDKLDDVAKGYIDYEPDAFYYNVGNISGSFMFGNNKRPVNIPFDGVNIEPVYGVGKITGFILTDTKGLMYYFGNINASGYTEITSVSVEGPDIPAYTSSWYLQKIVNPMTMSEITFDYTDTDYSNYTNSVNYSSTKTYESNIGGFYYPINSSNNTSIININTRILTAIHYSNGYITFGSSPSEDGGNKIDNIMFMGRRIDFQYDYFISSQYDNNNPKNSKRLRLLSITESIPLSTNVKTHTFEYSNIALPNKNSKFIDHWGYYNGATGNTSLIPFANYAQGNLGDGANRNPNPTYSGAGMLKKIIYPTGGSSEFTFERNAYGRFPTIPEISTPGSTNTISITTDDIFNDEEEIGPVLLDFDPQYKNYDFYLEVDVSTDQVCDQHSWGKVEIYKLFRSDPPVYSQTFPCNSHSKIDLNSCISLDNEESYSMKVIVHGRVVTTRAWVTYKKYKQSDLDTKREYSSGGVRINQIKNYDPVSNKTEYRSYDYNKSGYKNSELPEYYSTSIDVRSEQGVAKEYTQILVFSSPVGGLGYSPNSISYEKVTEYLGTPTQNAGKTETVFNNVPDQPFGGTPYLPNISNQWLRSKVKSESYYNFIPPATFELKKMNEYIYEYDNAHFFMINGFKASRIKTCGSNLCNTDPNIFAYSNFNISTYYYRLKQTRTLDRNSSGDITSIQDYFYENPKHLNPTRIETQTSDGKMLKTVFKYPLDYTNCSNNCKDVYFDAIDACSSTFVPCNREIETCITIYGNCWNAYVNCYEALQEEIKDKCKKLGTNWIGCSIRKTINADCGGHLTDCLNDNGYFTCLNNIQCNYIPCIVEANNSYNSCLDNYQDSIFTQYENASDENEKGILLMALYNVQNTLVEKRVYLENNEIEYFKLSFGRKNISDDFYLPVVKKSESGKNSQSVNTDITYDNHNQNLNITQITPKGIDSKISYHWGYNGKYLVAKFDNMLYSVIENNTNGIKTELDKLDDYTILTNPTLRTQLQALNDLIRSKAPAGAFVTTYTYLPQVGITSETDPSGKTIYYEYDPFGRLIIIRNQEGNIVKRVDYHYAE